MLSRQNYLHGMMQTFTYSLKQAVVHSLLYVMSRGECALMYYLYHPSYYHHSYYPPAFGSARPIPAVNPELLYKSANQTKKLMREANLVLDKISQSKEFDRKLMYAAQASNVEEVKRLIRSIGVASDIDIHFTPDGFRVEFRSKVEDIDCCKVIIALRWR